ncbi:hypothetical protein PAAL109150_26900 [Paenibacillus alkaliterrae]
MINLNFTTEDGNDGTMYPEKSRQNSCVRHV